MPQHQMHQGPGRMPTCGDKMKAGFALGACIGLTIGGFFGASAALRSGLRGKEFVKVAGKTMLQVGGSFGTFMTIGVALRC